MINCEGRGHECHGCQCYEPGWEEPCCKCEKPECREPRVRGKKLCVVCQDESDSWDAIQAEIDSVGYDKWIAEALNRKTGNEEIMMRMFSALNMTECKNILAKRMLMGET